MKITDLRVILHMPGQPRAAPMEVCMGIKNNEQ